MKGWDIWVMKNFYFGVCEGMEREDVSTGRTEPVDKVRGSFTDGVMRNLSAFGVARVRADRTDKRDFIYLNKTF